MDDEANPPDFEEPEPGTVDIPRLDSEGLTALARGIVTNTIFCANDEHVIECAFGMFLMLASGKIDFDLTQCGALYADMKDRLEMSMNGYPIFFQASFLHIEDLKPLMDEIDRMCEALGIPKPEEEPNAAGTEHQPSTSGPSGSNFMGPADR